MRIDRLIVESDREDHIARHGVTVDEVTQVVEGNPLVRRERHGYYRLTGQTIGGRYLTVFLAPRESGEYGLVTARDASEAERRQDRDQRRR